MKFAKYAPLALVAFVSAGCTVSAAPSSTSETSSSIATLEQERFTPCGADSDAGACCAQTTATTGHWSCGSSGIRTGEKMATTADGYADNCTGRATVDVLNPSCGDLPASTASARQTNEIYVSAVGASAKTASACAQSTLEYTIWQRDATTGQWSVGPSGVAYGVLAGGYCNISAPAYHPVSKDWSEFEISAVAYEPTELPAAIMPAAASRKLLDVNFDVSFVQ